MADALSRQMGDRKVIALSLSMMMNWEALKGESKWDKRLNKIKPDL